MGVMNNPQGNTVSEVGASTIDDHGIVRRCGWERNDDGQNVFRAIVDFPSGPPDLPIDCVWNSTPVKVVRADLVEALLRALDFMATSISSSATPEATAEKFRIVARAAIAKATASEPANRDEAQEAESQ